ncbi:helix-turn-helix domain-containing protein [Macrococcus animalis]|uniref:helix-turn-helix domain-containing protein n=1 Tax=Macrococcus animalis TaxID=3395467 RepID=UPI0039BE65F6
MTFFNKNISGDKMKTINRYINSKFLHDKSTKSLWKLLNGMRTQQTYFDALMQDLLPVYELYPKVSLQTVEKLVLHNRNDTDNIQLYPYFYYASEVSFVSLTLLLQTVSEYLHDATEYIPCTNRLFIQQHIKQLFLQIKQQNRFLELAKEVDELTQSIEKEVGSCYFIHLLNGHHITPTSIETISRQFEQPIDMIQTQLFIEKNYIIHAMKSGQYDLLRQLYVRAPLHVNTNDTYQRLLNGNTLDMIQAKKGVRVHTIQDHVIEIMIKDYPLNIDAFLSIEEYNSIEPILRNNQFGKLKSYFELSPVKDYFKLKIAIVKYKMEQYK